jgi:hypothetical protein
MRLAREIDTFGQSAFRFEDEKYAPLLEAGRRVAAGHGVEIKYESGRIRTVRA